MASKPPTVEQFLADLDHTRADDIARFRSAIIASDAELSERIKWNAPSFGYDGEDRVTFRLQPRDRFELILHRGAKVRTDPFYFDDPDGLITWASSDRGSVTVPVGVSGAAETQLLDLVHRWLAATR